MDTEGEKGEIISSAFFVEKVSYGDCGLCNCPAVARISQCQRDEGVSTILVLFECQKHWEDWLQRHQSTRLVGV